MFKNPFKKIKANIEDKQFFYFLINFPDEKFKEIEKILEERQEQADKSTANRNVKIVYSWQHIAQGTIYMTLGMSLSMALALSSKKDQILSKLNNDLKAVKGAYAVFTKEMKGCTDES